MTTLHGRSEFTPSEHGGGNAGNRHFVPEGWEDTDRGICPACGQTVRWMAYDDEGGGRWEPDGTLTVLVVTEEEWRLIDEEALGLERIEPALRLMYNLNRPFEEVTA